MGLLEPGVSAGRSGRGWCSSLLSPAAGTTRDSGPRPQGALGTEATVTPPLHTRGEESAGGAGQEGTRDRRRARAHTHTRPTHYLGGAPPTPGDRVAVEQPLGWVEAVGEGSMWTRPPSLEDAANTTSWLTSRLHPAAAVSL